MTSKSYELSDTEEALFEKEDYNLNELKLSIIIEQQGKKKLPAKTLIIHLVDYTTVMEKINLMIQKLLGNSTVDQTDYELSFKATNAHGPSSSLDDKLDFEKFLSEYKTVISAGKKMSIIVIIDNKFKKNKS